MNPQPRDYESPALTVELQALQTLAAVQKSAVPDIAWMQLYCLLRGVKILLRNRDGEVLPASSV